MMTAYIALGSNLGSRAENLRIALEKISALPETRVLRISSSRETIPVSAPPGSPLFLNAAAVVESKLSPSDLMKKLLEIEAALGRRRDDHLINAPRPIDLDILLIDQQVIHSPALTVPHPRMHDRRFVLEPLAEIAPDAIHPQIGKTVRELLRDLDRREESETKS